MKFSMLLWRVGVFKLILELFLHIYFQGREIYLGDFMKNTSNGKIGLCWDVMNQFFSLRNGIYAYRCD